MIEGIDHFVLTVADLDATLDFYARVLGARIERAEDRPAAALFGNQKINIHQRDRTFEPKARTPTPGAGDFCLIAEQPLRDIIEHLQRENVSIEVGPVDRVGARGAMRSIYLRDPDGNLVEIARYE